jgi:ABC-2 type transport system ATP-binding protein
MPYAVELEGVTKRFGQHVAVDHLDLKVPEGAVYGFIGPNGSGKTTTLRMILRILYPEEGRIAVLGRDRAASADDRVGYLPEERGLYRKMRIRDILIYFARLKGYRKCRSAVDDWLARFGLAEWADRRVETLSKGMSQKVQFLVAVIAQPKLLILDEPFSGLDPINMELLKDAVLSLHAAGTTVIFSTHDMDIAERMCDTIFMIFRGKKVLDDTLEAIQAKYGQDTIRLRTGGNNVSFADVPGVQGVIPYGRYTELRMTPGADSQEILKALTARARIEHFSLTRPSLHDVFLRIAGADAQQTEEAVRG